MKRLHPRFRDEEIDEEGLLLYSTDKETVEEKAQEIDPRWAALNKLRIEN